MKLRSEVFRRAAELVAVDEEEHCISVFTKNVCSCPALEDSEDEFNFFVEMFKPRYISYSQQWWTCGPHYITEQTQLARHIALLLCAEMIEAGDAPSALKHEPLRPPPPTPRRS